MRTSFLSIDHLFFHRPQFFRGRDAVVAKQKHGLNDSERIPTVIKKKFNEIPDLTNYFCAQYLTDKYRSLCQHLVAKRPSPVLTGKAKTWACGVVYLIGRINFLFDKSQLARNPMIWLIHIQGLIMDAQTMPHAIQEEAFRRAMIPYLPKEGLLESQNRPRPKLRRTFMPLA